MKESFYIYYIAALAMTFALTAVTARILIPKLKSIKMGQKILDVGPRWHKSKEGTPTMGGLSFILASLMTSALMGFLLFSDDGEEGMRFLITMAMALLNGVIGFIDDYVKFFKKQNEGLSAKQKYLMQLVVAGAYLWAMSYTGNLTTALYIPYFDVTVELGVAYYAVALILLTGIVNSVNLTDGVDGLASSVTAVVGAFFSVAAFIAGSASGALASALLIGGCLGFLTYNFYPAKLFMGDTGSLFLGGLTVSLAFLLDDPLIILAAGFIYVVESASVMLQVIYFKLTHGKRLFKMSPIHHHFEKCGWSELKIVGVFSLVTAVMCAAAFFGLEIK